MGYDRCAKLGFDGENELLPFFGKRFARDGQMVILRGSRLARKLQEVGDGMYNAIEDGRLKTIQVKTELENLYGNFFFETWSNRKRGRVGWMCNPEVADVLAYYFFSEKVFYLMKFPELRNAVLGNVRDPRTWKLGQFPLTRQKKTKQANDTWGHPVPIGFVRTLPVELRRFYLSENQLEIDAFYLAEKLVAESVPDVPKKEPPKPDTQTSLF